MSGWAWLGVGAAVAAVALVGAAAYSISSGAAQNAAGTITNTVIGGVTKQLVQQGENAVGSVLSTFLPAKFNGSGFQG